MPRTCVVLLACLLIGVAAPMAAAPAQACGWEEVGELGPLSWHLGCIYQEVCAEGVDCVRSDDPRP